jgi:hypothetical protein
MAALSEMILGVGVRRTRRFLNSLQRAERLVLGWFGDYMDFPTLYRERIMPRWPKASQDPVFRRRCEATYRQEAAFCNRPMSAADRRRYELWVRLYGPKPRKETQAVHTGPEQQQDV